MLHRQQHARTLSGSIDLRAESMPSTTPVIAFVRVFILTAVATLDATPSIREDNFRKFRDCVFSLIAFCGGSSFVNTGKLKQFTVKGGAYPDVDAGNVQVSFAHRLRTTRRRANQGENKKHRGRFRLIREYTSTAFFFSVASFFAHWADMRLSCETKTIHPAKA